MSSVETLECELAIIGCGLSGMAAALFAGERGISTIQTGVTGGLAFASGYLDLMGVHPISKGGIQRDPWAAVEAVCRDIPEHPYARLQKKTIQRALLKVVSFLAENGLSYLKSDERNTDVLTPLGTVRNTYYVPQTMWNGVLALQQKPATLMVGFEELGDFSSAQITGALQKEWPALRWQNIGLSKVTRSGPAVSGDILARDMEMPGTLEKLANEIRPHLKDAEFVGLPAVLGIERTEATFETLSGLLGLNIFEIPTMPLSVPGLRLNTIFRRGTTRRGVKLLFPGRVTAFNRENNNSFALTYGKGEAKKIIRAQGVILASGRFWARGLRADRDRIREPLFGLPVHQPQSREGWHEDDFLNLKGHSVNRAGLNVDEFFRPVNDKGLPFHETLFAAGTILAHQDWTRMKCGSGLSISTALGAVEAFLERR